MSDKGYETPIMSTNIFNYKMSDKGYETPLCLLISLTIKCLTRDMRLYYVYKYL